MMNQTQKLNDTPEHRSYPGLGRRGLELLTGSIRRDALSAIRTTTVPQWELCDTDTPTVNFSHPRCNGRFIFSPSGSLEVLYLQTPTEDLHLDGSCDMAQRICRFAQRQVGLLFLQSKRDAVKKLHSLMDQGSDASACSFTYAEENINFRSNTENTAGWSRHGSVSTPLGEIELKADHIFYEIGGDRGAEMRMRRLEAELQLDTLRYVSRPGLSGYVNAGGTLSGGSWTQAPYAPYPLEMALPPAPSGVVEDSRATFKNGLVERIQIMLGGPSLDKDISLSREQIIFALKVAQRFAPSSK